MATILIATTTILFGACDVLMSSMMRITKSRRPSLAKAFDVVLKPSAQLRVKFWLRVPGSSSRVQRFRDFKSP